MSASTPPTPDGERMIAEYVSSNGASGGARANAWSDSARRLVVLGYITAVAMPLIGFILGIVIIARLNKPISKHGAWIIVVSIVASIVWVLVFTSGALNPTSSELNT
jgi:hypothetical protein